MIILEGIDGAGKTTICEYINSFNGNEIHHLRFEEKYAKTFLDLIFNLKDDTILDRSYITELVYGPIVRNFSKISDSEAEIILEKLAKLNVKLIYLKASKDDLLKRKCEIQEDYDLIFNYYESLTESYDKIINVVSSKIETHTIDTSKNDIESVKVLVKRIIRGENNE